MRVNAATLIALGAIAALVALGATDQILPATDPRTEQLRPWIAARAMGVTAYLLLALEVTLGLVLSHPRNTAEWRKTRQVFPWHEMVSVFTGAFLALHVALLAIDPYANVGVIGALVPGFSAYRPVAVGLGSIALYALIFTALTAKWTRLLPSGWWLKVHRVSVVVFLMTWVHAVLAGTDGGALMPLYLATGLPILAGVAHRWWTARVRPSRDRGASPAGRPTSPAARAPAASPSMSIVRPTPAPVTVEEL
jgi:sulfoxide reductase heme-binding subunit YedZ